MRDSQYNILEKKFLSIVLNNPSALSEALTKVPSSWFEDGDHARIYDSLGQLYAEKHTTDHTVLAVKTGNPTLVNELVAMTSSPDALDSIVELLRNRHVRASVKTFASELADKTSEDDSYGLDEFRKDIDTFMRNTVFQAQSEPVAIGDLVDNLRLDIFSHPGGDTEGLRPHITELEDLVGTFAPGSLVVVAGRPSMGKSMFALDMAAYNGITYGHRGLFLSLEMQKELVGKRLLSRFCGVDLHHIVTHRLTPSEIRKFYEPVACLDCGSAHAVIEKLSPATGQVQLKCLDCGSHNILTKSDLVKKLPLIINDKPGLSARQIAFQMKYYKDKYPDLRYVLIDYLQKVKLHPGIKNTNDAIADADTVLIDAARETNTVLVLISQLNRQVELRDTKRPVISDLRGSGSIEQDADYILFVHRPYIITQKEEEKFYAEIILAKQRNGPIGIVPVGVDASIQQFYNQGEKR